MRKPNYLSPSALMTYMKDPSEYYLKYLGPRLPSLEQTKPMSVGSAFDYYVKTYIAERVFGRGSTEHLRLGGMFESSVEPHNRDWAREAGAVCMEAYTKSGALGRLMILIAGAIPVMEDTVTRSYATGLVLLGKPDLFFFMDGPSGPIPVILDWKVNGYCSKASPKPGYQLLLEEGSVPKPHKQYTGMRVGSGGGIEVNIASTFENIYPEWALQCTTYSWVCQANWVRPVSKTIACIDQLACDASGGTPRIRVAQHRGSVSLSYQEEIWTAYNDLWRRIQMEHIFDLPISESRAMQLMLDGGGAPLAGLESLPPVDERNAKWMADMLQDQRQSAW